MRKMIIAATAVLLSLALSNAAGAFTRTPVTAENGMVVTSQRLASEIGVEILKQGGNAVDAAVAVGYALAVVNPCCGNIGGGGFATIRLANGESVAINFRETAPLAATKTMFLDDKGEILKGASLEGYLAVGVPGTVMGLDIMLSQYGTLKREQVMAPAIKLAEQGFVLAQGDVDILGRATEGFAKQPNVAAIFLKDGRPLKAGDRLIQTLLAASLKSIAAQGPDAFYRGDIAERIVAASTANGGKLARKDFEDYSVRVTPPLTCSYRGYALIAVPPPSSGGTTICLILGILEGYAPERLAHGSASAAHLMAEAMRHAFVDRNFLLGDPDFVPNPLDRLLSDDYAAAIRGKIDPNKAASSAEVKPGVAPHEGMETTHYSAIDKAGNAVAVTYTINAAFGARVIAQDTGFFLNDEMDDFTIKPGAANLFGLVQGEKNSIAPGKRPLSSMSPTIVLKDGKPFMIIGSPGGSRIISIVVQAIVNVVDNGMTIQEAVNAPRLHHQWLPDEIAAERFALSPDTRKILEGMGHKIVEQTPWGAAEAILIGPKESAPAASSGNDAMALSRPLPGLIYGGHDDRRPAGAAVGF